MSKLVLTLIFTCCVTAATKLSPAFEALNARRGSSASPLLALLGDSRQLFANQFFSMADVYFHSGYYPTIFDARKKEGPSHLDVASHEEEDAAKSGKKAPPDDDENFLGRPKDWIEKFGRHFFPTVHTHLQGDNAREMLPWLKLSAEMDPKRVETYVTASYWLRSRLNKSDEAIEFLRQGLRVNPDSYEILLELGRVVSYDKHNPQVARNLWERALDEWRQQDKSGREPDPHAREEILGELVRDDQQTGNLAQELADLQELEKNSPNKASLEQQIKDVKAKMAH